MTAEPASAFPRARRRSAGRGSVGRWRDAWRAWTGVAGLVLTTTAAPAWPVIRVVGSDLLGADFSAAVNDYAKRNEQELSLELEGSRQALSEIAAARADVAVLVLRPEEKPPEGMYRSVPFGYFTTVVLVPEALPVTQLSFSQLAGIFGANAGTNHVRWGELGVAGEAASRAIEPEAMAGGTGLSLELFRHLVLAGGALKPTVARQTTTAALLRKLSAASAGSIALAGSLPARATGVRVLLVARGDQDVAFGPTPENVEAGDYPLRLTLWLVVRKDFVRAGGLDFLRFLLGDESADGLARAGLVSLPAPVRRQTTFDLEQG